jgi:hypothetical protein
MAGRRSSLIPRRPRQILSLERIEDFERPPNVSDQLNGINLIGPDIGNVLSVVILLCPP